MRTVAVVVNVGCWVIGLAALLTVGAWQGLIFAAAGTGLLLVGRRER